LRAAGKTDSAQFLFYTTEDTRVRMSLALLFCHASHHLEQGIRHNLTGLLSVRFLRHGSSGHEGGESLLQVILSLLFGVHETHACVHDVTEINPAPAILLTTTLWGGLSTE